MKKTELVRFRCTTEERKMIEDHSRNDGLTISEYILKLVVADRDKRIQDAMSWDELFFVIDNSDCEEVIYD